MFHTKVGRNSLGKNIVRRPHFTAVKIAMFSLLAAMPAPAIMLYSDWGQANESIYANNFGNGPSVCLYI
jgi:hypothetical protein